MFAKSVPNNSGIEEIIMFDFTSEIIMTNMLVFAHVILYIYLRTLPTTVPLLSFIERTSTVVTQFQ